MILVQANIYSLQLLFCGQNGMTPCLFLTSCQSTFFVGSKCMEFHEDNLHASAALELLEEVEVP